MFVQFISSNLTDDQYYAAIDWASRLSKVLQIRPVMKSHYNVHNSELLKTNNNISIRLLRDLLRKKSDGNEFRNAANYLLKNMDLAEINMVRDFVTSAINVSKEPEAEPTEKKTKKQSSKKIHQQPVAAKSEFNDDSPVKKITPIKN